MDTTTTYDIRHRLHRYDTAVQETRDHALERSSFGRYRAGAPYFAQYPLREILASFKGDAALTEALAEYDRITRELKIVERTGGRAYREELFRDLPRIRKRTGAALLPRAGACAMRGEAPISSSGTGSRSSCWNCAGISL